MTNMRVVTAPDNLGRNIMRETWVFLAGGITDCPPWQDAVIQHLSELEQVYNLKNVVIFNPRRDDFDVTDEDVAIEQIKWEHRYLEACDLFTVFFSASGSLQPIALYEMGKYANRKPSVITVEEGYKRQKDVLVQAALDGIWCGLYDKTFAKGQHARQIDNTIAFYKKHQFV